jgi:hypothetical protein
VISTRPSADPFASHLPRLECTPIVPLVWSDDRATPRTEAHGLVVWHRALDLVASFRRLAIVGWSRWNGRELVDLIQRELLTVEETPDGGDWLLTLVAGTATRRKHGALLDYEKRLLDGLSGDGGESRLSSLADRSGEALDKSRKFLIRDAAHQGWLRHLRHDQRTTKGEELAEQVRSFRRDLRRLVAEGDQRALSGQLLPMPCPSACCPMNSRR